MRRLRRARSKPRVETYRRLFDASSVEQRRFYNVGAGGFSHPCWTNVDFHSDWYKHYSREIGQRLHHDLLGGDPLPIDDQVAEVVYSSHTIEHVTREAARSLFRDAHRVLVPGGYLRITCPNNDLDCRAYRAGDRRFFYWAEMHSRPHIAHRLPFKGKLNQATLAQLFLTHVATSVSTLHVDGAPVRIDDNELARLFRELSDHEVLDHCTSMCPVEVQRRYPGNHMTWWTPELVMDGIKEAGFDEVYLSGYGQSACPVLRDTKYFDNTHPKISLYVEARKN